MLVAFPILTVSVLVLVRKKFAVLTFHEQTPEKIHKGSVRFACPPATSFLVTLHGRLTLLNYTQLIFFREDGRERKKKRKREGDLL